MKIDIFSPPYSQYGSLNAFTEYIYRSLKRCEVECRLFDRKWTEDPKAMVETILEDPPDCTLSFNGLLPDAEGNFFCDYLKIPHVAYLVDAPNHYFSMVNSPLSVIGTIDEFFCEFFKSFNHPQVLFLPHATPSDLFFDLNAPRPYDLAFVGSYIEPIPIEKKYSKEIAELLGQATELCLSDSKLSFIEAFTKTMNQPLFLKAIDTTNLNYPELFDDLEDQIRGEERVELIRALSGFKIDIFGDPSWSEHLNDLENLTFHPPVTYEETFEIYKKSKIVLNSSPIFKRGAHERIFTAMACGAAVVTGENQYLEDNFQNNNEIIFFNYKHLDSLAEQIEFYLNAPQKRMNLAIEGRNKTLNHHTWDQRAKQLLDELPSLLEKIGSL